MKKPCRKCSSVMSLNEKWQEMCPSGQLDTDFSGRTFQGLT